RQGPSIRTLRERDEGLEMERLRLDPQTLGRADRRAELVKEKCDRILDSGPQIGGREPGHVELPQILELLRTDDVEVLGADVIELLGQHEPRVRAFEPDEPRELSGGRAADE